MDALSSSNAPGQPGKPRSWMSAAKSAVGGAVNQASRVWFTLSGGGLTEIYFPQVDWVAIRRLSFVLADGRGWYSVVEHDAEHRIEWLESGIPAFRVTSTTSRYWLEKEIHTDPGRDVLLISVRFSFHSPGGDRRVYALVEPALANRGDGNTAWLGEYKGEPMLFAEREAHAVAVGCSAGWRMRSVGYAGVSDGWEDLRRHGRVEWGHQRAERGFVTLTGEINQTNENAFLLVLGFGDSAAGAGHHARAALLRSVDEARAEFCAEWRGWQSASDSSLEAEAEDNGALYRASTAVMRLHESKLYPGGIAASLSIPWGGSRGERAPGYHLVWTRDVVESAGGLLAARSTKAARSVLGYLATTQEPDGRWSQNMWADGRQCWTGVQLDEAGFPVLMADRAWRDRVIDRGDLARLWPMVRRALSFIVEHGPATPLDRWENTCGFSPFTMAVDVSALLAGAAIANEMQCGEFANFLTATADAWNNEIDRLAYVTGTALARTYGVDGYYVWLVPSETKNDGDSGSGHHPGVRGDLKQDWRERVSPDALALVRFGLRAPDDIRIINTVRVIDATLRVELPGGSAWRRYTGDGYGERADGAPFTSETGGIGRAWPLLVGERAHFELAAGRIDEARRLAGAIERFAGPEGMLPEQLWDADDVPDRCLFFGRPTGSSMPLVWAHAEYVKLLRSLRDGAVFDMPPHTKERYLKSERSGSEALIVGC